MNNITWKMEYSVGIKEIDEQHQHFFGVLNELYTAIYAKKEIEWMNHVFAELDGYIRFHFATEEKYFDEFSYEGTDHHKKSHAEFSKRVGKLERQFDEDKESVTADLVKLLEDWFVNHINHEDKMYVQLFHDHNIY